ncbi:MAG: ABC transporter permease [Phototrophicaceae bacterium]|jgi:ABC-2 type transport system permease protein
MLSIWIVFRRELARYFNSLIYYWVAAAFLALAGFTFYADLTLSVTLRAVSPQAVPVFLALGLVFFAPILTMRAFAEERREGTMELLLTAPVPDTMIVLGKFLSAWCFLSILLVISYLTLPLLLAFNQRPDLGHGIAAYSGIWLYGGAALAIGMMFSAATENQIVAAFLSSSLLLVFYLGNLVGQVVPNIQLASLIRELSFMGHFEGSFAVGVILLEDMVYFVGVMIFALYICTQFVASQRWG